jgi:hypothetical protein
MTGRDTAEQAQLLRIALLLGGPALIIGAFTVFFLWSRANLHPAFLFLGLILVLPLTWGLILLVEHAIGRSSQGLVTALHAGHAASPRQGFSRQEALVAQGRLDEAAAAYRLHLAEHPDDVAALLALGRLLAGPMADAEGAEAAYLTARRCSAAGDWDRIISNDLIDLYERTKQEGRLCVELARFGALHRGTNAGAAALERLRALKADERPPSPHGGEGVRG